MPPALLRMRRLPKVLDLYDAKVSQGELHRDPAQAEVAALLDALASRLGDWAGRPTGFSRFFSSKSDSHAPRGLYIVGDVGRGKTMLMDLFFDLADVRQKRRVHFHAFMADVHTRIHEWRQASRRGVAKGSEPIGPVAASLARDARLLCFDEFAVTDIADAMILGRLFTALFEENVVVVATSNVAPDDLYRDGLNRTSFLPFIGLLQERMDIVRLDAAQDFRYAKLTAAATWFTPADATATVALDQMFLTLTGAAKGQGTSLPLLGRQIAIPQALGGVARFSFASLCEAPLGAADYLAIAREYGTILIDGIRPIGADERNLAKRFITMIDTFYDEQVKVIASAASEPEDLYQATEGREFFEFRRAVSRLHEMRSLEYLALPHGHGRPTGNSAGLVET